MAGKVTLSAADLAGLAGTPVIVPHTDFDTPTGNPLVVARKGYGLTRLGKSAMTPFYATHHAPIGHEGVWHSKHPPMQLPPYIQNIRNALMRNGMNEREAHAMAVAAVKRWSKGKLGWGRRKVTPTVQRAAAEAVAQWEELRRNHP